MLAIKSKHNLTQKQKEFIESLISGMNPTQAARNTGYSHPGQASYLLMQNPKILAAIRLRRQTFYQGEFANLAVECLKNVMLDPLAPATARVSAARTVLELSGDLNGKDNNYNSDSSLAELTPDQLSLLIKGWEQERFHLDDCQITENSDHRCV